MKKFLAILMIIPLLCSCSETENEENILLEDVTDVVEISNDVATPFASNESSFDGPFPETRNIAVPTLTSPYSDGVVAITGTVSYSYVVEHYSNKRYIASIGSVSTKMQNTSGIYLLWTDTGSRAYIMSSMIDYVNNPESLVYVKIEGTIVGAKGFFSETKDADEKIDWYTFFDINF